MIRTKNILAVRFKFTPILNRPGHTQQCKYGSCPPPVKNSNELMLTWKKNGDQKQAKKEKKENRKYKQGIYSVNPTQNFHLFKF
jgi:hypothetical protein